MITQNVNKYLLILNAPVISQPLDIAYKWLNLSVNIFKKIYMITGHTV